MKRRRAGYLVLGVLVAHLVVISVQVDTSPGTSVLHAVTFGLLSEAQRLVSSTVAAGRDLWDGYVSLRGAHEEKIELQEQIARLQLRLQAQDALVQQAHSLERLLELDRTVELMTLSARVIGIDATPWFRTITVDRGLRDGVETELAVIAPGGVVGRVVGTPGMRAARVQLIIDRNAAAGALVERTRVPGVVVGAGDGMSLRMEYVSNLEDVQVGDTIVTSGADGIYPHGLTVGTVTSVRRGPSLYKTIDIEPAMEFDRLEHVLIVTHDERLAAAGDVR
ncbi:MAG: rod shape-determining protein MreC [Acidobacteria bacterium]|nr:rod shape-determining protein MreC [Acidobacteriota bacterium]